MVGEEFLTVAVVLENALAVVTTAYDVVNGSWILNTQLESQWPILADMPTLVNSNTLD